MKINRRNKWMSRTWRTRSRGGGERAQGGTADGLFPRADVRPVSNVDDYRACQAVYRRCPDGRVRWI
jgi:hypothetical protein